MGNEKTHESAGRALLGRRDILRGAGAIAGTIAASPLLGACGGGGAGEGGDGSGPSTSFGVLRAPTGALAVVIGDHGWFKKDGVSVQFKSFAEGGGPKIVQAMAGGTPEIGLVNLGTAVQAVGLGTADLVVVAVPDEPSGALPMLSTPEIKSISDLKGKKVTTPEGGGQYYELNRMLAKFKMVLDDVDYKPLSVGDGQAAFLTGSVDAVISSANGTALIKKNKPKTRTLFTYEDFGKPPGAIREYMNPDVIVASRKVVRNKANAIAAFVQTYHTKGISYLTESSTKKDAVSAIQDYMKSVGAGVSDLKVTADVVDAIKWYDLKEDRKLMQSARLKKAVQEQARFWVKEGVIKKMPDLDSFIDPHFITAS